jgi:uncharacterized protein
MFCVDLNRLQRSGAQDLTGPLPVDAATWQSWGVVPEEPAEVTLRAALTGTGQLLVRGRLRGRFSMPCRRCLAPVSVTLDEDLYLLWVPEEALEGEEDGEIRLLPAREATVDLADALREELFLRIPTWLTCREDCAGLCPSCGQDLADGACSCSKDEGDPRWEALRKITFDQRK